jgi:hypothetical protein
MRGKVIFAFMGLVAGAMAVSALAWVLTGPSKITAAGYVALGLCLVLGCALTAGLTWLMFYSANHGYDDIDREE